MSQHATVIDIESEFVKGIFYEVIQVFRELLKICHWYGNLLFRQENLLLLVYKSRRFLL